MRRGTRAAGAAIGVAALAAVPRWAVAAPPNGTYKLVFDDEFSGPTLDPWRWSAASPGWTMPNSASTAAAGDVSVDGGTLTLAADRPTAAGSFDSGSVSTYQKYTFASGYAEARIKLPTTPGSWPAFWGLYTGWPPEADIMEYPLSTDGGTSGYAANQYSTNYHYTNAAGAAAAGAGVVTTGSSLAGQWHTFGVNWTAGASMAFYLDGKQVQSYTGASVAQMASMYMILDYAVGGWPGTPSTAQWAAGHQDQTVVDYVRVYQTPANTILSSYNAASGSWDTAGNWTGVVPQYQDVTARFPTSATGSAMAVSWSNWRIAGGLLFDSATPYTLGGSGGGLQLSNSAGAAAVTVSATTAAAQTVNAKLELDTNTTVTNNSAQTLSLAGQIVGGANLTFAGPGTTTVSAANAYTGNTQVGTGGGAAVVRIAGSQPFGPTGTVTFDPAGNGSTARLELTGNATLPNAVALAGRNNATAAVENVSGTNGLLGTVSAAAGGGQYTIQSDAGTLTLSGSASSTGVALTAATGGPRTFTLAGAGNGVVSGAITDGAGTVGLAKAGTGTWTLGGANTFTGPVTVSGGTLRLTSPAAAPVPVGAYSFDAVTGPTVANGGSAGAAANGTLANGATITAGGGHAGNAVSLANGASVNISSGLADLGPTANWTVSAWVRTTADGGTILSKGTGTSWSTGNTIFYLGDGASAGGGGIPAGVRYAGGFLQASTNGTPVDDGAWHQVAYVGAAGAYAVYVDGVAQPLSSSNAAFGNADVGSVVRLGVTTDAVAADGTANFNGLMDDVAVYNRALTPAQVAASYAGTLAAAAGGTPLPATADVTVAAGATLDVNGLTVAVASLSGDAGSALTLGTGRLTVGSSSSTTFAGAITGTGSLVKVGAGTLALAGGNTYTGGTTVTAGTLAVAAGGSLTGPVTVGAAGRMTWAGSAATTVQSVGAVTVNAGGVMTLSPGAARTLLSAASLSVAGTVDLGTNDLDVRDGSLSAVTALAAAGFAGGTWAGPGLTSTAAASDARYLTAVGVIQNVGPDGVTPLYTSFDGLSVAATDVLTRVTLYGDANLDGSVTAADYTRVDAGYLLGLTGWADGDFNYDGVVDGSDYTLMDNAFNQQSAGPTQASAAAAAVTAVPEPAWGAATVTVAGLVGRSRRHRRATIGA